MEIVESVTAALAAFLGTFTPKDFVTSGLGLAAIALSSAAFVRVGRSVARPRIDIDGSWGLPQVFTVNDEPRHEELMNVIVRNNGSADAYDVRVNIPGNVKPPLKGSRYVGTIDAGGSKEVSFNMYDLPNDCPRQLRVDWLQYPPSKGKRKKRIFPWISDG